MSDKKTIDLSELATNEGRIRAQDIWPSIDIVDEGRIVCKNHHLRDMVPDASDHCHCMRCGNLTAHGGVMMSRPALGTRMRAFVCGPCFLISTKSKDSGRWEAGGDSESELRSLISEYVDHQRRRARECICGWGSVVEVKPDCASCQENRELWKRLDLVAEGQK